MDDSSPASDPISFLAAGDSYTIGESVPASESWPQLLAIRLGLEPTVLATTGWTSGELLSALEEEKPVGSFGLVSLQIGVNDQYRGLSLDEFATNLRALLERIRALRGHRPDGVFAVSIPDWGVTPFAADRDREAVATDIDRFNAALTDLTTGAGVPLVDVTGTSRAAPDLVAPDGLHPSGEQYGRWVDSIAPIAEAVLGHRTR